MSTVRHLVVGIVGLLSFQELHAEGPVLRDISQIQFEGDLHYSVNSIRVALSLDSQIELAIADDVTDQTFLNIVQKQIIRGYHWNGFRDANVNVSANNTTGVITAVIVEGNDYERGDVKVTGLSDRECEYLVSLVNDGKAKPSPLKLSQPNLSYWKRGSSISFITPIDHRYDATVKEALASIGYPQAEFSIEFPTVSNGKRHSLDLQIAVLNAGPALKVGQISFTGLEKHTPAQVMEFLDISPEMPLTLRLREQIADKLLRSGRFLMAEVKHAPFLFDPAEPLELKIRVREYEPIAPLNEVVTPQQGDLIKLSQWLSDWKIKDDDIRVQMTVPNERASDVAKSVVPPMLQPLCDTAIGTGQPGHVSLDIVTNPVKGSVVKIEVTDPDGNVSARRTIVLTATELGLVAWQSKKKWFRTTPIPINLQFSISGLWPTESERLCRMDFGFKSNSRDRAGLQIECNSTAAALIQTFEADTVTSSAENGVRRLELGKEGFLELQQDSGAIRDLQLTLEETKLNITTGKGLLETELTRLQRETHDWPNQCRPGYEWSALASMILDDVKTATAEDSDLLHVCLALLSNEAAVARYNKGLDALDVNRVMMLPTDGNKQVSYPPALSFRVLMTPTHGTDGIKPNLTLATRLFDIGFLADVSPAGSFACRLNALCIKYWTDKDGRLLNQLCDAVTQDVNYGPIDCMMLARVYTGKRSSAKYADLGLERLSTAAFERDMAPYLEIPCKFRETTCAVLTFLEQSTDEDAERIVRVAEHYLRDHQNQPINIRPLLLIIRSHPDKSPEDLLKLLLPIVWEGGLRSWVETDLHRLVKSGTTQKTTNVKRVSLESPVNDDDKAIALGAVALGASSKIPDDTDPVDRPFPFSPSQLGIKAIGIDDAERGED